MGKRLDEFDHEVALYDVDVKVMRDKLIDVVKDDEGVVAIFHTVMDNLYDAYTNTHDDMSDELTELGMELILNLTDRLTDGINKAFSDWYKDATGEDLDEN